jgi:ribosome-associated protein
MDDVVVINPQLSIPRAELTFRATRSGGPGGQHVNTSSTRVELLWNVVASSAISDDQRARIRTKLGKRIGEDGVLRLTSSGTRSQLQNKEDVTERFARMLERALHQPKPRRKTKPSKASKEARLQGKKRRAETKRRRGRVDED